MKFELRSGYKPCGDQPRAIRELVEGVENGLRTQVLRGVTGSGKTFTMANVIAELNRPALIISHNKTLAAQLCNEFREFFPNNRVEFFVSYYDYYMPESYIPVRDLYIEKEMEINEEIDKLRHSATCSLFEREDTIVVASVSCIYGLGAPDEYYAMCLSLRPNQEIDRKSIIKRLTAIQYQRNDIDFVRGTFRVRGDVVEIFPSNATDIAVRVEFFGDTIERISQVEAITGKRLATLNHCMIFPNSHYVLGAETDAVISRIRNDMLMEVDAMKSEGKALEAQRLFQRVNYDIEMVREMGYCKGVENYSRYFDNREIGQAPYTLLNYFPKNFLTFIDESHMTLPQIKGMYHGDRARKENLVAYGFRMKSAFDNRPLRFEEFDERVGQLICVSATPAPYELNNTGQIVDQIVRPTGLLDPHITIIPTEGQIDHLIGEIRAAVAEKGKVLITTLTKKMAETLTAYLKERNMRVRYMHHDIDTLERIQIITDFKRDEFDVLIGINLLREGIDLPDVELVAILDADKEGFLRSESALIQTIGRAARNVKGRVIMYADKMTGSMTRAVSETNRRRAIQDSYNKENNITPKTVKHSVQNTLEITVKDAIQLAIEDIPKEIDLLTIQMKKFASDFDFENAILLRERISKLKAKYEKMKDSFSKKQ